MNFKKPKFWDFPGLSVWSILLYPLSLLFLFASSILSILKVEKKFHIPIICIGNIYLGGTGKTPFCIELFSILKTMNKKPVFIRKKYDSFQDEVDLQKLTGPVYQNRLRKNALKEAMKNKASLLSQLKILLAKVL